MERVTCAEALRYPGTWADLTGALKWAKQRFDNVTCLSHFGTNYQFEHRRSSFQLDCYDRAGLLPMWDKLPLDGIKLGTPKKFTKPTILFADLGQSSPFLQKDE